MRGGLSWVRRNRSTIERGCGTGPEGGPRGLGLAWIGALLGLCVGLCVGGSAGAVSYGFTDAGLHVMDSQLESFVRIPEESFEIANDSGIEWGGFTVTLAAMSQVGPYPFIGFIDLEDPGIYSGPGMADFIDADADPFGLTEVMSISGVSVPTGTVLAFTADLFGGIPEGMTSYEILGRPTVDVGPGPPGGGGDGIGNPIPEPGAALLFAVGTLALAGASRPRSA